MDLSTKICYELRLLERAIILVFIHSDRHASCVLSLIGEFTVFLVSTGLASEAGEREPFLRWGRSTDS